MSSVPTSLPPAGSVPPIRDAADPRSASTDRPPGESLDPRDVLRAALDHAAHLLPIQGPIGVFVHHNTLHAFQSMPFDRACVAAARRFGAEPFMPEAWFRDRRAEGRISDADLTAVLQAETPEPNENLFGGRVTRAELRRMVLSSGLLRVTDASRQWLLAQPEGRRTLPQWSREAQRESLAWMEDRARGLADPRDVLEDALVADPEVEMPEWIQVARDPEAFSQVLRSDRPAAAHLGLWAWATRAVARRRPPMAKTSPLATRRVRDRLLEAGLGDADALTHEALIPCLAAFLDQGVAYWPPEGRGRGFVAWIAGVWSAAPASLPAVWRDVGRRLAAACDGADPWGISVDVLRELGHPVEAWAEVVASTLLALPGWTGMFHRIETDPELAPHQAPPCSLIDLLAVRLLLDEASARTIVRAQAGNLPRDPHGWPEFDHRPVDRRRDLAFDLFQIARILQQSIADLEELDEGEIEAGLLEIEAFGSEERRRIWHLAYERHYRRRVLGALAAVAPTAAERDVEAPRVQIATCIDDREEAYRRYLEEFNPAVETFGVAGFFGVAMAFKGASDGLFASMCPVVVTPAHDVEERMADAQAGDRYRRRRKILSLLDGAGLFGSRGLARGWLATVGGLFVVLPFALRVLSPGWFGALRQRIARWLVPPPQTRLVLRAAEEHTARGRLAGFSAAELAERVARLLRDSGIARSMAPLVALVAHGSTSVNNPHISAYNCGACGGYRGGPNARLFAQAANDPEIRHLIEQHGVSIPAGTWFLAGYHDTTTDDTIWYDEHLVPAHLHEDLAFVRAAVSYAGSASAHERCRRFMSAPLAMSRKQARKHVLGRSEDLGQPRPECGHATNAVAVFGRRRLTRGVFLDRRAFLVSYDPDLDHDAEILGRLVGAMGPVGAGISLEYYFSFVDNERYGCGTKLPHNVVGLVGVMNGAQGDLRTGLPWQMVEIHEPMRLLVILEATPEDVSRITERNPEIRELVTNEWIQLALVDPRNQTVSEYARGSFVPIVPPRAVASTISSVHWYRGRRDHLPPAVIRTGEVR